MEKVIADQRVPGNSAPGTEIAVYISEGGDDSNDGTREQPLWSMAAALDRVRGSSCRTARFVVTGSITEVAARYAMIDITGRDLPVICLQGGDSDHPGILDAKGLDRGVMYIADGNTVYLGEHIVVRGGVTRNGGGGGILISRGTVVMRGAEISDNDASYGMGGGVYVGREGEFIMESGLIARNKTLMNGGGVHPDDGGKFTMLGGVISGNEALISGAGVFVGEDSQFVMRNGLITDNTAGGEKLVLIGGVSVPCGKGGGVYVSSNSHFAMEDGKIENNHSITVDREDYAGSGGGVFVEADGKFVFEKGKITRNGVMNWGGGVCCQGSFVCAADCLIGGNIARLGGGGVLVSGKKGSFIMNSGLLMNNFTAGKGGAVHVREGSSFTMEAGIVIRNKAHEMGDALALSGLGTIKGGAMADNLDFLKGEKAEPGASPGESSNEPSGEPEGKSLEEMSSIIVVEEQGKLVIYGGEVDGKIAMKREDQMEDRRKKKEAP